MPGEGFCFACMVLLQICKRFSKFMHVCVWGMSAHFVREGYPEETLPNPFGLTQSSWMLYYIS